MTDPRATARRSVFGLRATSTMCTSPAWVRWLERTPGGGGGAEAAREPRSSPGGGGSLEGPGYMSPIETAGGFGVVCGRGREVGARSAGGTGDWGTSWGPNEGGRCEGIRTVSRASKGDVTVE